MYCSPCGYFESSYKWYMCLGLIDSAGDSFASAAQQHSVNATHLVTTWNIFALSSKITTINRFSLLSIFIIPLTINTLNSVLSTWLWCCWSHFDYGHIDGRLICIGDIGNYLGIPSHIMLLSSIGCNYTWIMCNIAIL